MSQLLAGQDVTSWAMALSTMTREEKEERRALLLALSDELQDRPASLLRERLTAWEDDGDLYPWPDESTLYDYTLWVTDVWPENWAPGDRCWHLSRFGTCRVQKEVWQRLPERGTNYGKKYKDALAAWKALLEVLVAWDERSDFDDDGDNDAR